MKLLLFLLGILAIGSTAFAQGDAERALDYRRRITPGRSSLLLQVAFPMGTDMNMAAEGLGARLRALEADTFQVERAGDSEIIVRVYNIDTAGSPLASIVSTAGIIEVAVAERDRSWLADVVERAIAPSSHLRISDTAGGAVTVTTTSDDHPPDPQALIDRIDSAASRGGKQVRYDRTRERLKIYHLSSEPVIDLGRLDSVRVTRSRYGDLSLFFTLSPGNRKIFSDFTGAHMGEIVPFMIDGSVLMAPAIMSRIDEGRLQIALAPDSWHLATSYAFILSLPRLPASPRLVRTEHIR